MTYKLDPELRKITSMIKVIVHDKPVRSLAFENGEKLCEHEFEKNYVVTSLRAVNWYVVIELEENQQVNDLSWNTEWPVSFF